MSSLRPISYATALLRRADVEALYPAFFYPRAAHARDAYLLLRALNVELASLSDSLSTGRSQAPGLTGQVRFAWWRDGLAAALLAKPGAHPVLAGLAALPQLRQRKLSSYHFTRLVNAREQNYLKPSFLDLHELAEYSSATQASLLYLQLQILEHAREKSPPSQGLAHATPFEHDGTEHDPVRVSPPVRALQEPDALTLDHAASHLAVVITISILLRSIPHHAAQRISVVPVEIARHSLAEEALFRAGPAAPGLQEAVATLVGIAFAELRTARECFNGTTGIPDWARSAFLGATPAQSYLDRLSSDQVDFNVFDPSLHKRYWKLPFQVWSDSRRAQI